MGILNRWRQFGRRYFWLHLLVAVAGFSIPLLRVDAQEVLYQVDSCTSLSRQSAFQADFSQLARLKDVPCCPVYVVDYRHQYAICTVIRRLSISWVPAPVPEAIALLRIQYQVLLITLNLLLNRKKQQPMPVRCLHQTGYVTFIDHRTGIRLAQLQGIRAGPRAAFDPEGL